MQFTSLHQRPLYQGDRTLDDRPTTHPTEGGATGSSSTLDPSAGAQSSATRAQAIQGGKRFFSAAERAHAGEAGQASASRIGDACKAYVGHFAPTLHAQIEHLEQRGWQVDVRSVPNMTGNRENRKVVIDPRIAVGLPDKPHAYLSVLAYQVGHALDETPISLRTSEEYVDSSLRREASGVLNELDIRHDILSRPDGADISKHRGPAWAKLIAIHRQYLKAGDRETAHRQIAQALPDMPVGNGRNTYADAFMRQYEALEMPAHVPDTVLEQMQACSNEMGTELPAERIKVMGHRPGEQFHWLPNEHFRLILLECKSGFQQKGFADDEIAASIIAAVTRGTKLPIGKESQIDADGSEWSFHTYYDSAKQDVFSVWIKHAAKPGQIAAAMMDDQSGTQRIESSDGKLHVLDLAHAKTLMPARSAGFLSYGIDEADISGAIMTAIAAGVQASPKESDGEWKTYRFHFRNMPEELMLRVKEEEDGGIADFEMPAKSAMAADSAPTSMRGDIDAILTGSEGQAIRDLAGNLGIDPKKLIAEVVSSGNLKRGSLENPGFDVYRATVAGKSVAILGRFEGGKLADIKPPSKLDVILRFAPLQEERYIQLQKDGWAFKLGTRGGGTYSVGGNRNEIVVDPLDLEGSVGLILCNLVHEMGHAVYDPDKHVFPEGHIKKYDEKNKNLSAEEKAANDNVRAISLNEGHAMFCEFSLLDEVVNDWARKELLTYFQSAEYYAPKAFDVYRQWNTSRQGATDPLTLAKIDTMACLEYGELFKRLQGSDSPDGADYEKTWRAYHNSTIGPDSRSALMEKLSKQYPSSQVWSMSEKLRPISFDDVQIIHRLPKQPGNDRGKIIYLPKHVFFRDAKDIDCSHFNIVIGNALNFGSVDIEKNPGNSDVAGIETAVLRYTKQQQNHIVHLQYMDDGCVFDVKAGGPELSLRASELLPPPPPAGWFDNLLAALVGDE